MTLPAQKPRQKKLLDQLREELRTRHYALRTENTCIAWVRRYILFHNKRHPIYGGGSRNQCISNPSRA